MWSVIRSRWASRGQPNKRLHRTAQAGFDWPSVAHLLVLIGVAVLAKISYDWVMPDAVHYLRVVDSRAAGETHLVSGRVGKKPY